MHQEVSNPSKQTQHKKRVIVVETLYQYFLEGQDKELFNTFLNSIQDPNLTSELKYMIEEILLNAPNLKNKINTNLKSGWQFDQLKPIEQSILYLGAYEIMFTKTEKPIIINEAVILAKQYCDNNVYKYINGVLDKLNR